MPEFEKLEMEPLKTLSPIPLVAGDDITKYVVQGMVEERFYSKELIDQKLKNIDQKFEIIEERTDKKFSEFYNKINEAKTSKREYIITITVAIFAAFISSPLLSYLWKMINK